MNPYDHSAVAMIIYTVISRSGDDLDLLQQEDQGELAVRIAVALENERGMNIGRGEVE